MKKIFIIFLFAVSFLFSRPSSHEVRAVWLSTASGEWPKSASTEEQQRSLIEIFNDLHRHNFNTIFFQIRPRGNTFYRSQYEPWAAQLTGVLGSDPGWDPLDFAVTEAHKRGMELHAWFNVAKVWGQDTPPSHPKHLFRTHRDWLKQVDGEWWIDMGIPAAREYTASIVMEIVQQYDIDGIHFDFIRYPGETFDDWKSFKAWSDGVERSEWRRNNITSFVRECYTRIYNVTPWVKVGSAPVGIYQSLNNAQSSFTGYSGLFQDSRRWLREKIHDYLVPQIYWSIGVQQNPYDPDFSALCFDWVRENYDRHIYAGIGLYRDNVRIESAEQVDVARWNGTQGAAFFRYEQLSAVEDRLATLYRSKALVPAMRWKDSIPPLPPVNTTITKNGMNTDVIRWQHPKPAPDGDTPFRYVIYRSLREPVDPDNPENILDVIPGTESAYFYRREIDDGGIYNYRVASLDRLWNESGADKYDGEVSSFIQRYASPDNKIFVSQNYPEPFTMVTYLSVTIPKPQNVTITLRHIDTQKETTVVNESKKAGIHIIGINGAKFSSGKIECTLRIGTEIIRRTVTKK